MPLLKNKMKEFQKEWNTHRIRFDAKSHCPAGCPDDNYFLPELNNTQNYGFKVNYEDYNYVYQTYCNSHNLEEYLSTSRQNELKKIVENILNIYGETNINITNARKIYYTLRTYLH